ncbi:MAG TPA: 3'-5' exonuclease [Sphingomicrobium sp.]|nr:3'-5' exonuclease [Sphingomicrobium sp.]
MRGLFGRLVSRLVGPSAEMLVKYPSSAATADAEELARVLSSLPGYRVLRAIDSEAGVERLRPVQPGDRIAAVVDTETTGLDLANDRIIEVAVQRFAFDRRQRITEVERPRSWLEDPRRPLPDTITRLTGISDRDLAGQTFDEEAIVGLIGGADIVIAHNAAFDRPFLDRRFPQLGDSPWACSLSQLDWQDLGYDGRALGHLLLQSGRFFEGHRAGNDTNALTTLLSTTVSDGRTLLAHLLERCERESVRIDATGAPFEAKDALKLRGYRWDATRRLWWREVELEGSDEETAWLEQQVYRGKGSPRLVTLTPRTRFTHDRVA